MRPVVELVPVFTGTGSRARRTPTASSGVISEHPYSVEYV